MESPPARRSSPLIGWTAAFLCVAFILAAAVSFVLPMMVEHWKDIGVKELPTSTQIMVDFSDFTKNRPFFLGLLFAAAATATVIALMRRSRD